MEEKLSPEQASLPSLDDSKTLKALFQSQANAIANRLSEAQRKNVARSEVVETDKKAAALMASTLLGLNPAFEKPVVNTPEKFERNIRSGLAEELKKTGFSEKDLEDRTALFQIASYIFTNEVHQLINELSKDPDNIETNGAKALNDLLERWSSILERQ